MNKQFTVGQLVETKRHSFFMTISEKMDATTYKCVFGRVHKNGVFEHRNYAGTYTANELSEYK